MLLLLQLIGLSSVAFAQFFGGPHPLSAGHSGLSLSNYANGESEALPISQEELAHLMAQSLATSGKNYGRPQYAQQKHHQNPGGEDFGSNYEGGEGEEGAEPQQPDEESNNEGGYEQQERGEGSPYQGHSEEEQGGSDEGRDNSEGYENSGPSHQREGEGEHYQSGQYPGSQSYGSHSGEEQQREPQSGGYEDNQNSNYDDSSNSRPYGQEGGYQHQGGSANEYDNAVNQRSPQYNDYSYSGPGSGYSGHGSESYLTYDIRNAPNSQRYTN